MCAISCRISGMYWLQCIESTSYEILQTSATLRIPILGSILTILNLHFFSYCVSEVFMNQAVYSLRYSM